MNGPRQCWLTNETGRLKFREVLSSQLISMMFCHDDLWVVSPWTTDFDLLDNRTGNWNVLESKWGFRFVRFSEVLIKLLESGSRLRLVTLDRRMDEGTKVLINKLKVAINDPRVFQHVLTDDIHIKGVLSTHFWLKGSMNSTYSGAYKNDEALDFIADGSQIIEGRLNFEQTYGVFDAN